MKLSLLLIFSLLTAPSYSQVLSSPPGTDPEYPPGTVMSSMGSTSFSSTNPYGLSAIANSHKNSNCPFTSSSPTASIWGDAENILNNIIASSGKDNEPACQSLTASAAQLQGALERYKTEKLGGGNNYSTVNCLNYQKVFAQNFEEALANNAEGIAASDFYANTNFTSFIKCVNTTVDPMTYTTNYVYVDNFEQCAEEKYKNKLTSKIIECRNTEKTTKKELLFRSSLDITMAIDRDLKMFTENLNGGCSNRVITRNAINASVEIATRIGTASYSGIAAPLIALGSSAITNLVTYLFDAKNRQLRKDLQYMNEERNYPTMACAFLKAQKLYCDQKRPVDTSKTLCTSCLQSTPPTNFTWVEKLNFEVKRVLENDGPTAYGNRGKPFSVAQFQKLLSSPIDSNNKTVRQFLSTDVANELLDLGDERYNSLQTFLQAVPIEAYKKDDPSVGAKLRDDTARMRIAMNDLKIYDILEVYEQSIILKQEKNANLPLLNLQAYETVKNVKESFIETITAAREAQPSRDTHDVERNLVYMVNIFKETMSKQFERDQQNGITSIKQSLKKIPKDNHPQKLESLKRNFGLLTPSIMNCALAKASIVIPRQEIMDGDGFHKEISLDKDYKENCQLYSCHWPHVKDATGFEDFFKAECAGLNDFKKTHEIIKQELITKGTICGKKIEDID